MQQVTADKELIAYCGLYCGSCKLYKNNKCKGCQKNIKAGWCKVRMCCIENGFTSCSDCNDYPDPMKCKYFNNFMSKIFGFLFKSNRKACIEMIRSKGREEFARMMAESGLHSIKRR